MSKVMLDPTHDEMLEVLLGIFGDEYINEAEVAIYWFANQWHGGQWSNLYSAMCQSLFEPGPMSSLKTEDGFIKSMYIELVHEFNTGKEG